MPASRSASRRSVYGDPLDPVVPGARKTWPSNQAALEDYREHLRINKYSKNVQAHYPVDIQVFIDSWGDHDVTRLGELDIENWVVRISSKCAKLQRGKQPICWAKQEIARCPLLTGAKADQYRNLCPGYQELQPSAVLSYLRSLKAWYIWMVDQRAIQFSPVDPVFRRYKRRHRAWFIKRRMRPDSKDWHMEDVKRLIEASPIQRGIMYALAAKCFLREHEVVNLTVDPRYFNLDEGWAEIPPDDSYGAKRTGNNRIILDDELQMLLRSRYMPLRQERLKHHADGTPVTDKLVVTTFGLAWHPNSFGGAIRQQMRKDLVHAGLMTGQERSRGERLIFHGLRALATTVTRDNGAPDSALQVMRGDRAVSSVDHYDRFLTRLPELYRNYGPRIGI